MQTQTQKNAPQRVHPAYTRVFLILAFFTILEIGASYLPSHIRLPILIILAVTKAVLVILFFMHLKYDRPVFSAPLIIALILAIPITLIMVLVMPILAAR
jgi:cytochrome c oxidase subunit 4